MSSERVSSISFKIIEKIEEEKNGQRPGILSTVPYCRRDSHIIFPCHPLDNIPLRR